MNPDRTISERIRELRQERELSQAAIASELDMSQSAYSRRESGVQTFSGGEILQIVRQTGADVSKIFE